jgi:hypothetical protein
MGGHAIGQVGRFCTRFLPIGSANADPVVGAAYTRTITGDDVPGSVEAVLVEHRFEVRRPMAALRLLGLIEIRRQR